MDSKSKIILTIMFLLLMGAIGFAYYNYVIIKNFDVLEPEEEVTQEL